ncbi:hypothetical protein C4D60_Mb02t01370 [Musa balbisiana]|uniref:HTH myb-type domain-containing protein n=1 Tax=Musa balbisiana TaxID=52838 RepID=A0A4S8I7F7_MUSBA|nr:hypothetical protein C4D60_Mb02t01370 [Musa balbisiana]
MDGRGGRYPPEYGRQNGPRDWTSIRSKGLLPLTGKSWRLRWEERVVIDLQAQLGNKWAKFATYLPGRTDIAVKNFWSTRQKRLPRIFGTPLLRKSNKRHGKLPVVSSHEPSSSQPAMVVQSTLLNNPMPPPPPPLPLDHLPRPMLGLRPLEPTSFPIEFTGELPVLLGFRNELHGVVKRVDLRPGTPDSFLDELPSDMFDYPPPPASWTSQLLARIWSGGWIMASVKCSSYHETYHSSRFCCFTSRI